ncbi:MAG: histidine phosphatase family protein [Alphaproteobacteria bacterium]|nr:histidine phosphatase family protein [Alphaproteobacteria bacterium]
MELPSLPRRTFYFVRHGVTDYNRSRRVMGQIDVPLNAEGRRQAGSAAVSLRGTGVGSIFTSPLSRARETAAIIGAVLGVDVHVAEGLMERHWGIFQDRDISHRPLDADPEGGETQAAFMARAIGAVAGLPGPPPVLLVAHNGVCRALRRHLGLSGAEGAVPNAVPLRFDPTPAGWSETPVGSGIVR